MNARRSGGAPEEENGDVGKKSRELFAESSRLCVQQNRQTATARIRTPVARRAKKVRDQRVVEQ